MKANYNLPKKEDLAFQEGVEKGFQFGIRLASIGFNRTLGIGRKRMKLVEAECQRLLDELVDMKDPTWTEKKIKEALEQIK